MGVRKRPITPLGWEIKRRLAELQLTQKEFCEKNQIPMTRLSEIISGTQPNKKIRERVLRILHISS